MTASKLILSPSLSLPLDAVTQKFGFYGRTGSGKTYGATKLAEEMLGAGAQVVAVDPVGVWWGLRLGADGKTPGISIPVFGGLHGDVPLEPAAGKLVADLVVDRGISIVLDVSQFEYDTEKARFASDFADRFFFRKKSAPSAVHLFVEECQEFVPQNTQRGEERMLHVWQRLIRLGRNFGIGATLISQRPQDVNTKVRNQAECLFAFQLTGTHERKAIAEWMRDKGLDQDLVDTLPKLPIGTAHVWSPAWLEISKEVAIAAKKTFNASSTPEVGKRAQARELASIDLEQLRSAMAATIERARAEDPKALQKRIRELEGELRTKTNGTSPAKAPDPAATQRAVDAAVTKARATWTRELRRLVEKDLGRLGTSIDRVNVLAEKAFSGVNEIAAAFLALDGTLDAKHEAGGETPATQTEQYNAPAPGRPGTLPISPPRTSRAPARPAATLPAEGLTAPQQRILNALASFEALGLESVAKNNVAVFSNQSPTSSSFANNLGSLRTAGLLDYPSGGEAALTDAGRAIAKGETIHTLEDLHEAWRSKLAAPQWNILYRLIDAYPESIDRVELAQHAGASPTSSSYANNLGALRSLGVLEYQRDRRVVATSLLFPKGLS